jgi:hypothetical protein
MSVRVELVESEEVVGRGVRCVRWRLLSGARGTAVARVPGAVVESLPSAPGVVWQRRIELSLPVGARLEREVTSPRESSRVEVLEHLGRERRGVAQRVAKDCYVVLRDGRLERDAG